MSKFAALLAQLDVVQGEQEVLAKSLPQADAVDDKKIKAAAAEGANPEDDTDDVTKTVAGAEKKEEEEEEEEEVLSKSLTLESGEEVVDATDLLKSLMGDVQSHEDVLVKTMPQVLSMMSGQSKMLQQQGDLIKSMQSQIAAMSSQGRGRKAVVSMIDKTVAGTEVLSKSQQDGMSPAEFMLKANSAFDKKVITGTQLTVIDVSLRQGEAIDPALIQAVVSA